MDGANVEGDYTIRELDIDTPASALHAWHTHRHRRGTWARWLPRGVTGRPARSRWGMLPFRFGFQIGDVAADGLRALTRAVEDAGFDVIHTWDHVLDGWAPLAPLVAMADCTTRLRICPLVLNNDFHNPVHLARELASIDHLSDGRLEVGIGAGHAFPEYAATGQRFDPPSWR